MSTEQATGKMLSGDSVVSLAPRIALSALLMPDIGVENDDGNYLQDNSNRSGWKMLAREGGI